LGHSSTDREVRDRTETGRKTNVTDTDKLDRKQDSCRGQTKERGQKVRHGGRDRTGTDS
jgi:hypothetical protein